MPKNFPGIGLHNIILDIDDQLLCSDAQIEVGHMYDEPWRSFETF